uniref:Capsular polysaccharide biosynthesis protein n=1 Tax=uncultured Chloroflexota bacterium TaxID=166587 RepID=H5SQ65_9CHLR|nr:capsular polysaccharide biosynthesis protein [uncultured Chloroflexota bacterium]
MEEITVSNGESESASSVSSQRAVVTLASGSLIGLSGRLFGRFFLLLYQVLLASWLGSEQYGLFSLGWTALQLSLYMGPVGIQNAVIRFATPFWKKDQAAFRRVLQQSLGLAILGSLFSGGLLFLVSPFLALFFRKPELQIVWQGVAIALFFSGVLRVLTAMTRVTAQVGYSVWLEDILLPLSMAVLAFLLMGVWKGGLIGALLSAVGGYLLMVVAAVFVVSSLFPGMFTPISWERRLFRSLAAFSMPSSMAALFTLLIQWFPRLILGYFRPATEVGLYQAAFQIASLPALVLAATGPVFTPLIARLIQEKAFQEANEIYRITTKWTLYAGIPLVITMAFFAGETLQLFFGKEYVKAAPLLWLLLIAQLINMATGGVIPLHLMGGHQKRISYIAALSFGMTFLLSVVWTYWWGLLGAAMATAFGIVALNLIGLFSIRQLGGYWPFDARSWKGGLASLIVLLVTFAVRNIFPGVPLTVFVSLILNFVLFIAVQVIGGLDIEERYLLEKIRKRLGFQQ